MLVSCVPSHRYRRPVQEPASCKYADSVVAIFSKEPLNWRWRGSGFVVGDGKTIVTANHVVRDDAIFVRKHKCVGAEVEMVPVSYDIVETFNHPNYDVAIIRADKVVGKPMVLAGLPAIGARLELYTARQWGTKTIYSEMPWFDGDTAIGLGEAFPGSSGGLVVHNGAAVGIIIAKSVKVPKFLFMPVWQISDWSVLFPQKVGKWQEEKQN